MRIQHKDSNPNRLVSGVLPKDEMCVCVSVCQSLHVCVFVREHVIDIEVGGGFEWRLLWQ